VLSPYRVLDLADERGAFAGGLLAQLGAEVILVEPPDGNEIRTSPPFVEGSTGARRSLVHEGFNRGKRSVVLDLAAAGGRASFERLVAAADVVIETGGPAERAARRHLSTEELAGLNPRLIHAVVSPFGATGPKADWAASDLVVAAAGLQLSLTGDANRPPLRTAVPQTWLHASADAAVGVIAALLERASSGLGQMVDISAQHSWIPAAMHYGLFSVWGAEDPTRNGSHVRIGRVVSQFDFPAADGHITLTFLFGAAVGPFTNRFVQWMVEEGACDPRLGAMDFIDFDPAAELSTYDELRATITRFTATKTKAELHQAARERRLLVAPVSTLDEVLCSQQFNERGVWRDLQIPGVGRPARLPGPFVVASPPVMSELGPAPELGADTDAVASLERPLSVPSPAAATPVSRPLEGVRVLDLTISFAGPIMGRILADHGATVVKVESLQRPDLTRTAGVFLGGKSVDHATCFAHYNAGKLSAGLNLKGEGGREVLYDLVRWADVLVESFAPGALERLGLGEAARREINPDLICLSSSLLGQTGPLAAVPGYGNMAVALCGFVGVTGWPGLTPVGPVGAYTDIISPRLAVTALLAALDHRRRTGEAVQFDFGQGESCLQLLTLGLLDAQVNGRSWEGIGNTDLFNAPHGVYPAAGDDRWVAVACTTDEHWRALAQLVGRHDLADLDGAARIEQRVLLDGLIAEWTSVRAAEDAMGQLQGLGVPAHAVQNGSHCLGDAQLAHREWLQEVDHEIMGSLPVGTSTIRLSRTPAQLAQAGPTLGHDTHSVLSELLGYGEERIADLAIGGVLE